MSLNEKKNLAPILEVISSRNVIFKITLTELCIMYICWILHLRILILILWEAKTKYTLFSSKCELIIPERSNIECAESYFPLH